MVSNRNDEGLCSIFNNFFVYYCLSVINPELVWLQCWCSSRFLCMWYDGVVLPLRFHYAFVTILLYFCYDSVMFWLCLCYAFVMFMSLFYCATVMFPLQQNFNTSFFWTLHFHYSYSLNLYVCICIYVSI